MPEPAGLQRDEFFLRLIEAAQHRARVTDDGFAVQRGPHAARFALEKRHAERFLQFTQELRRGRLRHMKHGRRAMNVAFLHERDDEHQLPRLEPAADVPRGRIQQHF